MGKTKGNPADILSGKTISSLTHNINTDTEEGREEFENYLKYLIIKHEGIRYQIYDDATGKTLKPGDEAIGNRTIGVGSNMDSVGAQEKWDRVFNGMVDFNDARSGKIKLDDEQVQKLFQEDLKSKMKEIEACYKSIWHKLRANIKISIICAGYNSMKLIGNRTRFKNYIEKHVETEDYKYLEAAADELRFWSNRNNSSGLQKRRNDEADTMLPPTNSFYSPPNQPIYSKDKIYKVKLGKDIIPHGMNKFFGSDGDSKYFVWRATIDDKVRDKHLANHGKIYRRDNPPNGYMPGEDYNCRCIAEDPPKGLVVIDDQIEMKNSLTYFIRYGGGGIIDLAA